MKILMIVPKQQDNNKKDYTYSFPIGLAYISAVLKKENHKVDVCNMNHYEGEVKDIINSFLKSKYDFVCTGTLTMNYNMVKEIIEIVKESSKAEVILGGNILTSEPKTIFPLLSPDYGIIGEGEEIIIELLRCIEKRGNLYKVQGIVFKDKKKIIYNELREPPTDLDSLPFPDFDGFDFKELQNNLHSNDSVLYNIFDNPRPYQIIGSRGCPFNCTFCYHYSRYRKRSIKNIIKELKKNIIKYKINIIQFYDECISLDKERLLELCKEINKLRKGVDWEIKSFFQMTVHNIDDETLKVMKNVGVHMISYGFESMSSRVLKSMNKPITPKMISNAFHKTLKAKIGIQANFIFGDVAETEETFKQTLDWWKKNAKGQISLGLISPYPQSEIYKYCLRKEIIKAKEDYLRDKIKRIGYYNMTNMSNKEFENMKKEILFAGAKYYVRAKPNSIKKEEKGTYEIRVKCPFCKEQIIYKNIYIENKNYFDIFLNCRECSYRFNIVGFLNNLIYKNYSKYFLLRKWKEKAEKLIEELKIKRE